MKARTVALVMGSLFVCFTLASPLPAQEGHPMSGSWVGDWGPSQTQRNRVVVVLEWTGEQIAGSINPGPNAIPIKIAEVDTSDWSIHIEADASDAEGQPASYVIDGKIDDLGTYNRSIAGTWNVGATRGDFSITRQ
jgi:hypothetical protein